jgi:hypothetical protein
VWRFRSDSVASFHQYVDTAALRRVMQRDGETLSGSAHRSD